MGFCVCMCVRARARVCVCVCVCVCMNLTAFVDTGVHPYTLAECVCVCVFVCSATSTATCYMITEARHRDPGPHEPRDPTQQMPGKMGTPHGRQLALHCTMPRHKRHGCRPALMSCSYPTGTPGRSDYNASRFRRRKKLPHTQRVGTG